MASKYFNYLKYTSKAAKVAKKNHHKKTRKGELAMNRGFAKIMGWHTSMLRQQGIAVSD